MAREKQYTILSAAGFACGSVWATSVEPRNPDGWFFFHGEIVVASAWEGYRDIETREVFLRRAPQTIPDGSQALAGGNA